MTEAEFMRLRRGDKVEMDGALLEVVHQYGDTAPLRRVMVRDLQRSHTVLSAEQADRLKRALSRRAIKDNLIRGTQMELF